MSTSLNIYASRATLTMAIRWPGGTTAYQLLKSWIKKGVELDSTGQLLLQTEDGVEVVPVGNYIVLVGKHLHSLTPEDFHADYVQIRSDESL